MYKKETYFSFLGGLSMSFVIIVQSLKSCPTLHNPMNCNTPSFPVLHYLPEFAQSHVLRVGDTIQPSHPLLLFLFLPSVFPNIRVFSTELALLIGWPKYWSFSFSISPSNEYLGLISFKIDWFDLLAVQATLKSLLQHHSLKASILWPKYEWILGGHAIYFETASQVALVVKNLPAGARGSVPALGRSPGGGHGNPL